jgi:hypothetical protein
MREAVELDKQYFDLKKPSLEKLKLLPAIHKFLANIYFQKLFLQQNGLELLQEWIRKNPDGTYPALNQITQIIDLLSGLQISLHYLKNCQIGGYVMDLSKNMKDSKTIQKKAKDLVEKWSRIVWDINTNYTDIESENRMYEMVYRKKPRYDGEEDDDEFGKENLQGNKDVVMKRDNDLYSHAKIPKKGLFDFTVKPMSNINSVDKMELVKLKYNIFEKRKTGGRKKNE